jgi:hypothetical protein
MADEPLAVPDADRRHLAGCSRCQAERAQVTTDLDLEWILLLDRRNRPAPAAGGAARVRRAAPRGWRPARLGAGTAAVAAVLAIGAAAAAALTTVWAPTHVAPVSVSTADLRAIASLTSPGGTRLDGAGLAGRLSPSGARRLPFGELTWTSARPQPVASIARARALTGLAFAGPATLPAGVGAPRRVEIQSPVRVTIQFGRAAGPGVAGSTLQLTFGPAIAVEYGGRPRPGQGPSATMAVLAMRRPVATSTGASARQLEAFVLARPGLPADLARQLRLLGQPGATLPVPVPAGMPSQRVRIGGAPGVLVTAAPGVASGVVWESADGVVHAVAGLLGSQDVLNAARQIG